MICLVTAMILAQAAAPERPRPFAITVVDDETGRGVPLVELRTVNGIRYVTDSAGVVAFDEPGLLGQDVHFTVRSFGYEFPKDGFGIRGKVLKAEPGGSAKLAVRRRNVAERLYRTTGGGTYRDTALVGGKPPVREPLLNAKVLGQDSIQCAVLGGKVLWFWGDTNRPSYPLGNFHMPGATSPLPSPGGLDPDRGIDLTYYLDSDGFARPTAKMPGDGPTWVGGLTVVKDEAGRDRLFATYDKIRNMLETYQRGLLEWDEEKEEFRKLFEFPLDAPLYPQGHPFRHSVGGVEYVYFPSPFPLIRVKADAKSVVDFSQYEAFTPYAPGGRPAKHEIQRDGSGRVVYGWKKATSPAGPGDLAKLVSTKALRPEESLIPLRDADSGRAITAHGGSVNWNPYRKRWVMIFVESGGSSFLGEVHFAEADSPLGPWVYARKVATHADDGLVYSFYNPKHHPFLDKDGGRTVFFEGTYTATFSGNNDPTPRYDYNQIMYKLDLGRPALSLPVPIYRGDDGAILGPAGGDHPERASRPITFFAPDRPATGSVPVFAEPNRAGGADLLPGPRDGVPLFHALPSDAKSPPPTTLPLLEFAHDDGRHAYQTDPAWQGPGFRRTGRVVCHVWKNPTTVVLPRE